MMCHDFAASRTVVQLKMYVTLSCSLFAGLLLMWSVTPGIIEHLEPSKAAPFYKRIAQHYALNGLWP